MFFPTVSLTIYYSFFSFNSLVYLSNIINEGKDNFVKWFIIFRSHAILMTLLNLCKNIKTCIIWDWGSISY